MTAHRDLKTIIRERQSKTGESYTSARVHVMRERATLLGLVAPEPIAQAPLRVDAAVLKINRQYRHASAFPANPVSSRSDPETSGTSFRGTS
jgi:hypothetical protein